MHLYLDVRDQFLLFNGKIHLALHLPIWFQPINKNDFLLLKTILVTLHIVSLVGEFLYFLRQVLYFNTYCREDYIAKFINELSFYKLNNCIEKPIRQVLVLSTSIVSCHGAEIQKNGLRYLLHSWTILEPVSKMIVLSWMVVITALQVTALA